MPGSWSSRHGEHHDGVELWEVLSRYRKHDAGTQPGTGDVPEDAAIVSMQFQLFPRPEQDPPPS